MFKNIISNNFSSNQNDLRKARKIFKKLDLYESNINEDALMLDKELTNSIRIFQRNENLKEDGVIKPKGETEKLLSKRYTDSYHTIDTFMPRILKDEGGYNKGKYDPYGASKIGISGITLKEYSYYKKKKKETLPLNFTMDASKVSIDLARQIYDEYYYKKYNINKVNDRNTADHMLDIVINPGPQYAGRWYQESLNKRMDLNLDEDGVIGPNTRKAIDRAKKSGLIDVLQNDVVKKRSEYYRIKVKEDSRKKNNLGGWINRSNRFIIPPKPFKKPIY